MKCPNCNAEMPENATFCTKCWHGVVKAPEPVKKYDLDKEIEKCVSDINAPLTLKVDIYLRLNKKQVNAAEILRKKTGEAEKNFGEGAAGFIPYIVLGVVAFNSRKYEAAVEYFNRAIKIEPGRKEGYHNKGVALYCSGGYNAAVECFNKAIQTDPLYAISWYSKALTLIYANKLHEGINCYEKALKIDPNLKKRGDLAERRI